MKKVFALLLAAVLCLSLAACGGKANTDGMVQETPKNVQQSVGEASESQSEDREPTEETQAPAATKEELEGLWLAENGVTLSIKNGFACFDWYNGSSSETGMFDWTIAGNRMSFGDIGGGGPHVFEIINNNGTLSLKYLKSESGEACVPFWDDELVCTTFTAAKERTIELTVDNWQEYFEIRPNTHGVLRNSFGEFERLDYVNWALFLKSDGTQRVTGLEDVAIEYRFTDGYYSWFSYNFDTGEFLLQDAATAEECAGYPALDDKNQDFTIWYDSVSGENGSFLTFILHHYQESVTDNIYSFIGEAWGTMEIVRVKGTITVAE